MMTPVPPRSQSPLTQLTTSPRTCVAMIMTASLHPQRRRRNHPIPAVVRAAPSSTKRAPNVLHRGTSCLYAAGLRFQTTIKNRASPEQSSCGETRHDGTKEQENAHCSESGHSRPVSHLLNIRQRRST